MNTIEVNTREKKSALVCTRNGYTLFYTLIRTIVMRVYALLRDIIRKHIYTSLLSQCAAPKPAHQHRAPALCTLACLFSWIFCVVFVRGCWCWLFNPSSSSSMNSRWACVRAPAMTIAIVRGWVRDTYSIARSVLFLCGQTRHRARLIWSMMPMLLRRQSPVARGGVVWRINLKMRVHPMCACPHTPFRLSAMRVCVVLNGFGSALMLMLYKLFRYAIDYSLCQSLYGRRIFDGWVPEQRRGRRGLISKTE